MSRADSGFAVYGVVLSALVVLCTSGAPTMRAHADDAAQPVDVAAVDTAGELRATLSQLRQHPQADAGAAAMHDAQAALRRAAERRAQADAPGLEREHALARALVFLAGRQIELSAARLRQATAQRRLTDATAAATTAREALAHARAQLKAPAPTAPAAAPESSASPGPPPASTSPSVAP